MGTFPPQGKNRLERTYNIFNPSVWEVLYLFLARCAFSAQLVIRVAIYNVGMIFYENMPLLRWGGTFDMMFVFKNLYIGLSLGYITPRVLNPIPFWDGNFRQSIPLSSNQIQRLRHVNIATPDIEA